jgi:magnesium chelatase subunit I
MKEPKLPPPFPYNAVQGQTELKRALELSYIEPELKGVLLSGERGTAKSTLVRAFGRMMYGETITLPINATEDRVVGGLKVDKLVSKGEAEEKVGLLEEANGKLLYVDEVNLLDDHIVNIILDVSATGDLVNERESLSARKRVRFTLVGTMNPEEGSLRPQLLDRFGLYVEVKSEPEPELRRAILEQVLSRADPKWLEKKLADDETTKISLVDARARLGRVKMPPPMLLKCVELALEFKVEGHRGEVTLAHAARALAAQQDDEEVNATHLQAVARMALQHRRKAGDQRSQLSWSDVDAASVTRVLEPGGV